LDIVDSTEHFDEVIAYYIVASGAFDDGDRSRKSEVRIMGAGLHRF
jgi:hypothetical protein